MDFYTSTGELYHHGVKGQQWGVKNGPPYPLSDKQKKKITKYAEKKTEQISKKNGLTQKREKIEEARHEAQTGELAKKYNDMLDANQPVYSAAWDYATKKVIEHYGGEENIPDEFEDFKDVPEASKYWDEYVKDNPPAYSSKELGEVYSERWSEYESLYKEMGKEIFDLETKTEKEVDELVKKKFGVSVKDL